MQHSRCLGADTQREFLNLNNDKSMKSHLLNVQKQRHQQKQGSAKDAMKTNFDLAKEFMEAFGQSVLHYPSLQDEKTRKLRLSLIQEEVQELEGALEKHDIVEIADALTDILYVVYGAGHALGIDLDSCYREVHRSNMSKLDSNGQPIYREDGKVLKGENYSPPNLIRIVLGQ